MKVELSLNELCLVVTKLARCAHEDKTMAARINAVGYDALALAQHAAKCADLADRLHNEMEAAEHAENFYAENFLDNME